MLKKGNGQALDMVMFLAASIFQLIAVVSQIVNCMPWSRMYNDAVSVLISLTVSYLTSVLIAVIVVVVNKKKVNIQSILLFPLFILTWIPINILVLFKKECKWEQISHDRVIKIDEVA